MRFQSLIDKDVRYRGKQQPARNIEHATRPGLAQARSLFLHSVLIQNRAELRRY
jgi:hypothetical protein